MARGSLNQSVDTRAAQAVQERRLIEKRERERDRKERERERETETKRMISVPFSHFLSVPCPLSQPAK